MPQAASWSGMPSIMGRTETQRMILLTFCLVGLQVTWGIEMTYGTPYLLSLGLSKSSMSAVWIAGPLSGLIVQPVIGVIADNSRSKWGRRRPFIIAGSFVVAICLFVMGWAEDIVGIFPFSSESRASWHVVVAVGSIYAIDFAINVVMCASRSLIVDTLPISKQELGNAWASRMAAIGHILSYSIGCINLPNLWGHWLGATQFKQLCFIAAVSIVSGSLVTAYGVKERILISARDTDRGISAAGYVKRLFKTTTNLPPKIQGICWIQFWTWIGWFPFLFYSPTWVGETYFRYSAPPDSPPSEDKLGDIGRIGSTSLVIFSIITFVASVVFPYLVRSSSGPATRTFTPRPHAALAPLLRTFGDLNAQLPDLLTMWMLANILFGILMLLTPLVGSVGFATFLVACTGIPWAIAGWAPFALLGVEVNRLSAPGYTAQHGRPASISITDSFSRPSYDTSSEPGSPKQLHLKHLRGGMLDPDFDSDEDEDDVAEGLLRGGGGGAAGGGSGAPGSAPTVSSSTGETAGIYLGVLNVFTTLPQFVGNFISMIVFAIVEPGQSRELAGDGNGEGGGDAEGEGDAKGGLNAIAVCLCIGGASAMMGAYATRWLRSLR